MIRRQGEADSTCTIVDISLGVARISDPLPAGAKEGEDGVLLLYGGARQVPFRFAWLDVRQSEGQGFGIIFEAGIPLRRALTGKLFTGAYRPVIDEIVIPRVLHVIGKRLLR